MPANSTRPSNASTHELKRRAQPRPAQTRFDGPRSVVIVSLGAKLGTLREPEAAALRRTITEMYGE